MDLVDQAVSGTVDLSILLQIVHGLGCAGSINAVQRCNTLVTRARARRFARM
jgi:hypothetical protein